MTESSALIVACPSCGARNRIPVEKKVNTARCGRCQTPLGGAPGERYTLRCSQCGTRNRVPAEKLETGAKCGKCGAALPTRELFVPQPVMVTDANFEKTVLQSPLPVLLFCWAPWCPTCGAVAPIIDEFARDARGRIRVGKTNIDASPQIASRFNVLSVPYLFIFDRGQLQESLPGGMQKHQLMTKLARYL